MIIRVRLFLHYLIKIGVGALRIENFVAIHDGDEVLGVGEVDDVVGVAGEHLHSLYLLAAHFVVPDFIRSLLAELNKAMT